MGLCGSTSLETQLSREIDLNLHASRVEQSQRIKLLLLGAGGSGKSTVMRQFKMLYGRGFSKDERLVVRGEIRKNVVHGLQTLVQATRDHEAVTGNIHPDMHPHIDKLFEYVINSHGVTTSRSVQVLVESMQAKRFRTGVDIGSNTGMTRRRSASNMSRASSTAQSRATTSFGEANDHSRPQIYDNDNAHWTPALTEACVQLFSDPAVLKAEVMSNKLQLEDSLRYFRNHVERLGAVDYLPNDLDVAYVRIRTRGVHNLNFDIDGTQFMCVDVGGQRNERRKWISQFDNVDAVMFVASLAAYDMTLIEERTKNRAEEALELFEQLASSPYFLGTDILLFLNKKDLLEEKIKTSRIADHFPDFGLDTPNTYDEAITFFSGKYTDAFARGQDILLGKQLESRIPSSKSNASSGNFESGLPRNFSDIEKRAREHAREMSRVSVGKYGDGGNLALGNTGMGDTSVLKGTRHGHKALTRQYSRMHEAAKASGQVPARLSETRGSEDSQKSTKAMWTAQSNVSALGLNRKQREAIRRKQLYINVTHATDSENIRFAFDACQDIILRDNLKDFM